MTRSNEISSAEPSAGRSFVTRCSSSWVIRAHDSAAIRRKPSPSSPTQAVLNGDFSAITSSNCVSGGARQLKDPVTGQPFVNNQIPVSRFSPEAVKLVQSYVPISNDPCGKVTYGIPSTGDEDQVIGRVDWVQSSKHNLYTRYFLAQYQNPPVFDGKNALTTTAAGNWERVQAVTLADTLTFSGATLNSFHVSFTPPTGQSRCREQLYYASRYRAQGLGTTAQLPPGRGH